MIRLLLLFFTIFIISAISFVLVYGLTSLGMVWIAKEMGFFYLSGKTEGSFVPAVFYGLVVPAIMFGSIVTGMCCIIVYKALQKKQRLRVEHFISIFKSFLFFTALFCIGFYLVLMMMTSGKMGLLLILSFIDEINMFSRFGLPLIWLIIAWFWVLKYESKFVNDEEEWMLR